MPDGDDKQLELEKEKTRAKIALWSIIIYLVVGAAVLFFAILGFARLDDAIEALLAWGSFSSFLVGAAIGFYFGTK